MIRNKITFRIEFNIAVAQRTALLILLDLSLADLAEFLKALAEFEFRGPPFDVFHKNGVFVIDFNVVFHTLHGFSGLNWGVFFRLVRLYGDFSAFKLFS